MSEQHHAFDDATEIQSDALGLIDRDNRNHRKKQRIILDYSTASPGEPLLEVGCGDGLHAPTYASRFDYTGIDISESLCEETERQLESAGVTGSVEVVDARDVSFADDTFGGVVGTAVLHHLDTPRAALREWRRVTRPGGSITLVEPNYLFPKEIIETHTMPEEKHKINMRPWRLRRICRDIEDVSWTIQPRLYTIPWPRQLGRVYDRIDAVCRRLPGVRWLSMMLLVHGVVE